MAEIQVKLFATLARYRPETQHGRPFALPMVEGRPLREAISGLGLPAEAIRHVFVNGRRADLDTIPRPGDEVAIFPPIAGG